MAREREPSMTLTPLRLVLCIALGLWLGALAIALSAWLAWQLWPQQLQPMAQALAPAAPPAQAAQADDAQQRMFERYQQILHEQQAAQAPDGSPRNLNSPRCQFWMQQNRTAPTAKSQAHVQEFCY